MGGKWDKNKCTKPRHMQQHEEELQKAACLEAEHNALQALLNNTGHNPLPGDYRTKTGYHVRITHSDVGVSHQKVSLEEQHLASGLLWVPYPPLLDPTAKPVSVDRLYGATDPWQLFAAAPQQVGFNDLGEGVDGEGVPCQFYQLRQVAVKDVDGIFGYKAVASEKLDLSRPHLCVYGQGKAVEVPPMPFAPLAASGQPIPTHFGGSDSGYTSGDHNTPFASRRLNPSGKSF